MKKLHESKYKNYGDPMKIHFDNTANTNCNKSVASVPQKGSLTVAMYGKNEYKLDITDSKLNGAYGVKNAKGKTMMEKMEQAVNTDAQVMKNYAAVMSNSMSAKDYAKMQEEGMNPADVNVEESVTIMDHIKAVLAQSGVEVEGFTDDIDLDTLSEITGSQAMANSIMQQFQAKDIPFTEDNIKDTLQAFEDAMNLEPFTEGQMKYMVENQLDPTIEQLLLTKFSGSTDAAKQGQGYFNVDATGYFSKKPEEIEWDSIMPQMEQIIEESGMDVSGETVMDAKWLVEKGVPLTKDNFRRYEEVKSLLLPAKAEKVMEAIGDAICEGKRPKQAYLSEEKIISVEKTLVMEETRLKMTVEANWKLMESGFSIDTTQLMELVDQLKALGEEFAKDLTGLKEPEKALNMFTKTVEKVAQIPTMPAAVLGTMAESQAKESNFWTLDEFHTQGSKVQMEFQQVQKNYEMVMTEPRRDMGDSIMKAFRNVDDILQSMDMERNEWNERAVRILGYNSMEITEENIALVKKADFTVNNVIDKMTPDKVLSMIREGINPLETSMEDLHNFLSNQGKEDAEGEMEKYSRFLQKLDAKGDIEESEKESYIGIYRLLRQIEKSDGSVIGSLVQAGAQLNFKNLLSAVRTEKKGSVDVRVNDQLGTVSEVKTVGQTIDEQINRAYLEKQCQVLADQMAKMDSSYKKGEMERIVEASHAEEEVYKLLTDYQIPVTANNILAAKQMIQKKGSQYQTDSFLASEEEILSMADDFINSFSDRERAVKSFEKITDTIRERIETQYENKDRFMDIKTLQTTYKQMSIVRKMAQEETYEIPLKVGEEFTSVRVKLRHESVMKGHVTISMETLKYGTVNAKFSVSDRNVSGYAVTDSKVGKENLEGKVKDIRENLETQGLHLSQFYAVQSDILTDTDSIEQRADQQAQTRDLYTVAKALITTLMS